MLCSFDLQLACDTRKHVSSKLSRLLRTFRHTRMRGRGEGQRKREGRFLLNMYREFVQLLPATWALICPHEYRYIADIFLHNRITDTRLDLLSSLLLSLLIIIAHIRRYPHETSLRAVVPLFSDCFTFGDYHHVG